MIHTPTSWSVTPAGLMRRLLAPLLLIVLLFLISCEDDTPRVLVFSKTKGFKHSCIPFAFNAIQSLGRGNGFEVDTTRDATQFTDDNLRRYDAVIFSSTTGNVLNAEQQAAFERFIQAGGGFVGIHAAADTEYEWPWYDKLVGAHFSSHPHNSNVRKATIRVTDKSHVSTVDLPDSWERTDEWYNYRSFYSGIHPLAYLDEETYDGGTNGSNHAIAWYHEFDGGRAFYTGGGHEDGSYSEPLFINHLLGGIRYAMGTGKLDYDKAYAVTMPEENRFTKTVLVNDLNTPMELAVADDGRVFFTELLTANLSMYNTKTGKYSLVHQFKVAKRGGTGLIGVTLDPNFNTNHFLYLYYTPPIPQEVEPILFNLSRFTLKDDNTLDTLSEKVLLQVPVQEKSGSHHGGSLAWDKNGNLFLSTGDSSSPFPSGGYAPLDERPGKEYFSLDAQRGASNTNDLKGKVLRIHPEPDGTYTIPEGNLFPEGTAKTRPEIYAMGCRNPYRIAVNPQSAVLYWGEIGPDAGVDSTQGPRGYDEFNQAKKAGNYGWPYFIGNNQAYTKWNFATNTAGPKFVAEAPVNNSPNNTGLNVLPPAQPAMIWYPYASSPEFPELGVGGRSAMAGEFYTYSKDSDSPNKFPEYYDGALFVFDWMRNWVLALRFDDDENYVRNEPLMQANGDFRRPIDLAFGKDGIMYMLEYGSVYGADNTDARLVKIEYKRGNRPPVARLRIVDSAAQALIDSRVFLTSERRGAKPITEVAGEVPLRVTFNSMGTSDPDEDDAMTYEWKFDGKTPATNIKPMSPPVYTYREPGTYYAILTVKDKAGLTGSDTVLVRAGNQKPTVSITTPGNKSFFWDNKKTFNYSVKVSDKEDGRIDPRAVQVSYEYNPEPAAMTIGAALIAGSDCKACHTVNKISVGPSYLAVAQRYKGQSDAVQLLAKKIIAGGGGSWGTEHVMSAHPQLTGQETAEMAKYILALAESKNVSGTLPLQGSLALNKHTPEDVQGLYTLTATYTDKGANGISPITQTDVVTLRPARVEAIYADVLGNVSRFRNKLGNADHKSYLLFKNVDLTGIRQLVYQYSSLDKSGHIELRLDSQGGPVISKTAFTPTTHWDSTAYVTGVIPKPIEGRHDVFIFTVKPEKPNDDIVKLMSIEFKP